MLILGVPFYVGMVRGTHASFVDILWAALLGGFIWVGASQAIFQGGVHGGFPGSPRDP